MEEYWFKTAGWDNQDCVERCMVKHDGVMIGSVKCQSCEFCKGIETPCKFTGNINWIRCSRLEEAQGYTKKK
ncbi:MAG: hypothetical protein ACI86P_002710 [Flavobacteriales bacterium]|jgi:hypothetical protein